MAKAIGYRPRRYGTANDADADAGAARWGVVVIKHVSGCLADALREGTAHVMPGEDEEQSLTRILDGIDAVAVLDSRLVDPQSAADAASYDMARILASGAFDGMLPDGLTRTAVLASPGGRQPACLPDDATHLLGTDGAAVPIVNVVSDAPLPYASPMSAFSRTQAFSGMSDGLAMSVAATDVSDMDMAYRCGQAPLWDDVVRETCDAEHAAPLLDALAEARSSPYGRKPHGDSWVQRVRDPGRIRMFADEISPAWLDGLMDRHVPLIRRVETLVGVWRRYADASGLGPDPSPGETYHEYVGRRRGVCDRFSVIANAVSDGTVNFDDALALIS